MQSTYVLFYMLRAPVCKNQTNSKVRGKGGKFDVLQLPTLAGYWLDIGQAFFCEANAKLSSPNKLGWFAHLSCQSEHRICFILPVRGFNKSVQNPRSVQA